jgi:hypothetical protein
MERMLGCEDAGERDGGVAESWVWTRRVGFGKRLKFDVGIYRRKERDDSAGRRLFEYGGEGLEGEEEGERKKLGLGFGYAYLQAMLGSGQHENSTPGYQCT